RSGDGEPSDRDLAGSRIGLRVEGDLLAFLQHGDARAFERGGVYEHVSAAVIGLNEPETLVAVVELHCAVRHDHVLSLTVCTWDGARLRGRFPLARIWRESETCARQCGAKRPSGLAKCRCAHIALRSGNSNVDGKLCSFPKIR